MADQEISQLTALTTADQADVYAIVDDSANDTKKISQQDVETSIANSSNFVDQLVDNSYFTTELANDTNFTNELANNSNFVNELTTNSSFQSAVNNFVTNVSGGGSGGGGKPITFSLTDTVTGTSNPLSGYSDSEAVVYSNGSTIYMQDAIGYTQSRNTATDWSSSTTVVSYVLLNAYAYVLLSSGAALRVYRYNRNDLSAGGTQVTFSGATLTYGANVVMTSNGVEFFFNYDAGQSGNSYSIAKFTISGTTLTYVSATSAGSTANQFAGAFAVDSTTNYYGTNSGIIYQYDNTGTLAVTSGSTLATISRIFNWSNTLYGCDSAGQFFNKLYIQDTDIDEGASGTKITAVANQDLVAGQTVGISNLGGGVAIANRPKYVFTLPDTAQAAEYVPLGNDRVFMLYKVNGAATLKGIVGTIDRDTMEISVGGEVTYTTSLQGTIFEVALLDTDKVAIVYTESGAPKNLKIHVSTISGTTITANAQQAVATTTNDVNSIRLTQIATDKVALYTAEASTLNPLIRAITVSGTTLGTVGTAVTCIQVNAMVSHTTDALSMFGNADGTVDDTLQIATVSGTTVTVGTSATVNTVNTNPSDNKLCVVNATTIVLSYRGAPGGGVRAATISGTTPTLGTFVSSGIGGGQQSVFYDSARSLVMYGIGKYYTISGTTLTLAIGGIGSSWASTGSSVSNFVNMGTYYAVIDVSSSANNITIKGMSTIFTGFAYNTVARGGNVTVLIKGQVAGQTGLYAGYNYTANGTGGLTQDDTGIVTAVTDTVVSI